jgi:hypothetical protein
MQSESTLSSVLEKYPIMACVSQVDFVTRRFYCFRLFYRAEFPGLAFRISNKCSDVRFGDVGQIIRKKNFMWRNLYDTVKTLF